MQVQEPWCAPARCSCCSRLLPPGAASCWTCPRRQPLQEASSLLLSAVRLFRSLDFYVKITLSGFSCLWCKARRVRHKPNHCVGPGPDSKRYFLSFLFWVRALGCESNAEPVCSSGRHRAGLWGPFLHSPVFLEHHGAAVFPLLPALQRHHSQLPRSASPLSWEVTEWLIPHLLNVSVAQKCAFLVASTGSRRKPVPAFLLPNARPASSSPRGATASLVSVRALPETLVLQRVGEYIYSIISELVFWKVLEVESHSLPEVPCLLGF